MKRRLLVGLVIILCLALAIYETRAYFSSKKILHNVITTGGIKIELLEKEDKSRAISFPKDSIEEVMPGREIIKSFEVENRGKNQAYIRIKIKKDITLKEEAKEEFGLKFMILSLEGQGWIFGEEDCYYYKEALEPGEKTEPFFLSAKFDIRMGNVFQASMAKVSITAHATQVANNANSSLKAKGWPD